jgi:malate permease and related proteins
MENLIFSFNVVIPVFLVVAVGYFIRRIEMVDDKFVNTAIKFNFKVGLSTLIFKNIYQSNLVEVFNLKLVFFTFLCIVGVVVILFLTVPLFVKDRRKASAMIHTMYRSNFVLLGLPIAINMFGQSNIAPVALLMPIAIPTYNILAVVILSLFDEKSPEGRQAKIKSTTIAIITNPLILGSMVGLTAQLFSLKLPLFLEKAIFDIASLGTPLALITLGAQFNFNSALKNLQYSIVATIGRLVVIPFIVVLLGFLVGFKGYELGALFILFSSPTAISSYVMAKEMNSDHDLTGDVVLLSTLFSIFTIFAGIYLLRSFTLI